MLFVDHAYLFFSAVSFKAENLQQNTTAAASLFKERFQPILNTGDSLKTSRY